MINPRLGDRIMKDFLSLTNVFGGYYKIIK
jgi:hypothetical protein